jgi:hypothetical protein
MTYQYNGVLATNSSVAINTKTKATYLVNNSNSKVGWRQASDDFAWEYDIKTAIGSTETFFKISPDDPKYAESVLSEAIQNATMSEIACNSVAPGGTVRVGGKVAAETAGKVVSKVVANELVFGSGTKSATKLLNQMNARGWTEETVKKTVSNPFTTRSSTNLSNNNPATAYFNKDGSYVVVDDITKEVMQISNKLDPKWIPDSNIIDPYIPK